MKHECKKVRYQDLNQTFDMTNRYSRIENAEFSSIEPTWMFGPHRFTLASDLSVLHPLHRPHIYSKFKEEENIKIKKLARHFPKFHIIIFVLLYDNVDLTGPGRNLLA